MHRNRLKSRATESTLQPTGDRAAESPLGTPGARRSGSAARCACVSTRFGLNSGGAIEGKVSCRGDIGGAGRPCGSTVSAVLRQARRDSCACARVSAARECGEARAELDARATQSLPPHAARHAADSIRLVQGAGAALFVAPWLRHVCRSGLSRSFRLHSQRRRPGAESRRAAGRLRCGSRFRGSYYQESLPRRRASIAPPATATSSITAQVHGADRRRPGHDRSDGVSESARRGACLQHVVPVQDRALFAVRASGAGTERHR